MTRVLLALIFTAAVAAQPAELAVTIAATPFDEQLRTDVTIEVETRVPLTSAHGRAEFTVAFSHRADSLTVGPGLSCGHVTDSPLSCTVAPLPAGTKTSVTLHLRDTRNKPDGSVEVRMRWRDAGFQEERRRWSRDLHRFNHEFVVTHAGDGGQGSLRQALLDANAACADWRGRDLCRIRFDLGPAAIIRPLEPLPVITGQHITIDGRSNVTLDGSLLTVPANGLLADADDGAAVTIRELTIRSFPLNGIETRRQALVVESCVIHDNGWRGIVVARNRGEITGNAVFANGRSGIFVDDATVHIARNRIEGNGASGIFIGRRAAWIIDNVIAGNAHFGIATIRENRNADVGPNRIAGNGILPIDIDLDGPSLFPRLGEGVYRPANAPLLLSATFDAAAGKTVIGGRLEHADIFPDYLTYDVQFFAASASGDIEQYLGTINVGRPDFTISLPGDLRGRFLVANAIRYWNDALIERMTSELAGPVEVR